MAKLKPLTDDEGEVRELTRADFARMTPFSQLPAEEQRILRGLRTRGPQKSPKKVPVSIRLSADVVEGLRASGSGWQSRADEALRSWLQNGSSRARKK